MSEQKEKSWLEAAGCRVSEWVAKLAGHPYAQVGFILICVAWFLGGWNVNLLTAALSILAITLTQMVLNNQNEREIDAHRRDIAMHAKLDELISATRKARNDFVGMEDREEEEIVHLKEEVKEAIEDVPEAEDPHARETAKRAVDKAADELKKGARKINGRKGKRPAKSAKR